MADEQKPKGRKKPVEAEADGSVPAAPAKAKKEGKKAPPPVAAPPVQAPPKPKKEKQPKLQKKNKHRLPRREKKALRKAARQHPAS
jgi:hypothetical protein